MIHSRSGLRSPVEFELVGDSRQALQSLPLLLRTKHDRSFLKQAQEGMKDWWKVIGGARRTDKPMKPQVVAWELGNRLDMSCDSGTIAS
jgi:pyruvate dehydrogenase (quinone)